MSINESEGDKDNPIARKPDRDTDNPLLQAAADLRNLADDLERVHDANGADDAAVRLENDGATLQLHYDYFGGEE